LLLQYKVFGFLLLFFVQINQLLLYISAVCNSVVFEQTLIRHRLKLGLTLIRLLTVTTLLSSGKHVKISGLVTLIL